MDTSRRGHAAPCAAGARTHLRGGGCGPPRDPTGHGSSRWRLPPQNKNQNQNRTTTDS